MNLKQGDLENIILNALWDLEAAEESKIFVSHVQDHIKNERGHLKAWAYTTVKTVLDRLVDKELVARIPDVSDRRRFNIVLTPQGKEKVETVRPCMKAGRERAWAGLDDEAISQLNESLNQVIENIKQPNQS